MKSWSNRLLTVPQRIIYFNTYVYPICGFLANIFPLPASVTKQIQSFGNTFIWKGKHEQIAVNEIFSKYNQGGFNLINVKIKSKSFFLSNLIRNLNEKKLPMSKF